MSEDDTDLQHEIDDYLWERSGPPDPDVERLERTLGTLRYRGAPAHAVTLRPASWRARAFAVAAVLALAAIASWMMRPPPGPGASGAGWEARALRGSITIDGRSAGGTAVLGVDQWLDTSGADHVVLDVADIGTVTVHPESRLRLAESRAGVEHRLQLARGRIEAFITAPPRLFFVDTPAARAVDLGCAYELAVDETGRGELTVTLGAVSFERDDVVSTVPAEGACLVRPVVGPGTPYFTDAAEHFRRALESYDFEGGGGEALATVLAGARARDSLTLWHLVQRTTGAHRAAAYDRLAALSPPPPDVNRDAARSADPDAMLAWWDDLARRW